MNDYYKLYEKHILYEIKLFSAAYGFLINSSIQSIQYKIYLECFLIHNRNLYEFFIKIEGETTDIKAYKCIEDWNSIITKFKNNNEYLKSSIFDYANIVRINKLLSHLTSDRVSDSINKGWEITVFFNDMIKLCELFFNSINKLTKIYYDVINENKKDELSDLSYSRSLTTY